MRLSRVAVSNGFSIISNISATDDADILPTLSSSNVSNAVRKAENGTYLQFIVRWNISQIFFYDRD